MQPPGLQACSVLQNADGSLTVLGVGTDNTVRYIRGAPGAPGSGWSGWASVRLGITSALAVSVTSLMGSPLAFARWPELV